MNGEGWFGLFLFGVIAYPATLGFVYHVLALFFEHFGVKKK